MLNNSPLSSTLLLGPLLMHIKFLNNLLNHSSNLLPSKQLMQLLISSLQGRRKRKNKEALNLNLMITLMMMTMMMIVMEAFKSLQI